MLTAASFAALVAAPWFLGVSDASAQTAAPLTPYPTCVNKPTAQDSEAAHSAYLLGKRFFDESDYGSASHNFIDAFKLDCTKPELLLNIARSNELLGNKAEAIHALETYLQRTPSLSPDDKSQFQRRIDNLRAALASQPTVGPVPSTTVPVPTAPITTAPPVVTAPPPPSASNNPPPLPPPATDGGHSAPPWILVGVGGAAVIAGGVLLAVGAGDVSDSKNLCPNNQCPSAAVAQSASSKNSSGVTLETAGVVSLLVGAGAVGGGLLWHFLEPTGTAKAASLTPVVAPGFAGANVAGTF